MYDVNVRGVCEQSHMWRSKDKLQGSVDTFLLSLSSISLPFVLHFMLPVSFQVILLSTSHDAVECWDCRCGFLPRY